MAINKKNVKDQINRLMLLPGKDVAEFGAADEATSMVQVLRDEMGRALQSYAQDESHCQRIVDRLMEGRFRPLARDIRETAEFTAREQAPAGCSICEGHPWVTVRKLSWEFPQAKEGNRGVQYWAEGSERCRCTKGEWFRMKDRENDAKRAAGQPV